MTSTLRHCASTALCLAALLVGPRVAGAQTERDWWDTSWAYRKVLEAPAGGAGLYRAWVYTGGRARPDGSDIRVIGPAGGPVPFAVLHSAPEEGKHLLIFGQKVAPEAEGGGGLYSVYFGNPRAPVLSQPCPRCGLVLETRAIPEEADVSSWAAARETLGKATTVYGFEFWGQIFDAYNPFGPQSDYLSIYSGYINCPRAGPWRFAVLSDDASFLLIDDTLVAQWPGRDHDINRGRYGEHGGQIALSAGIHSLRYVAFSFGGPKRCAVSWVPPGAQKVTLRPGVRGYHYAIVPADAFCAVPEAQVKFCQHVRNPVCADFRPTPFRYLESGTAQMVAVKFESLGTIADGVVRDYRWDFGDGQTSAEAGPIHVFLACGLHEVKFGVVSSSGARDLFAFNLDVEPIWHDLDFSFEKKDAFWNVTRDYVVEALPTGHLLAFREFLHDAEKRAKLFETCQELDKRRDQLQPLQLYDVAMDLGNYYLDPLGQWKTGQEYYDLALQQCAEDDYKRRFNTRFQIGDLLFYYANDLDRAQEVYESLPRDFPRTDPVRSRVALIRRGDVRRNQSKLDEARRLYEQAEADPTYGLKEPPSIVEGRYTQEVETYLKEGDGERALETLEKWLWHCPTKRLEGYPAVLRLKANMLMRRYEEVRKQAGIYLSSSNDPDYVPQVHVLAGEACLELGRDKEAREHWETVLNNWKESPAVKDAADGLYRLAH